MSAALTALHTRCSTPIALEPLYQALASQQIELGPHFRWMKTAWRGADEAFAVFQAPIGLESMAGYVIHPGLLDACFQLAGLTNPVAEATTLQLPFAVEKVAVYQAPQGAEWWGHAQQVAEGRWNIQLYDGQGQVLIAIVGFVMRAVPTTTHPKASWQEWLYTVRWEARPLPDRSTLPEATTPRNGAISAAPSRWLICADTLGIGDALAAALRHRGEQPVVVKAGAAYAQQDAHTFTIALDTPADYARLLKALPAVQSVIHLWSLDTPTGVPTDLDPVGRHSCGTILHWVQTLLQTGSSPSTLWLVTQDAQAITQDDKVAGVNQAPVWGLGKVIALEHPELHPICIDLEGTETPERQAAALCAELLSAPDGHAKETQVALRQGQRYMARLVRFTMPPSPNPASALTCDGPATYLITGGLGGLGLLVARWFIEQGAKHLVLVGRSRPKPEVQHDLNQLAALSVTTRGETPATVTVIQADVADYDQLARVLSRIDPRYPLRGIVHAAGVVDDATLWQQDWARFARVQAPKIAGAWNLHRLTEAQPLDFFVLFSSAAGLLGSPGQANYAAANAFLDAFAQYRRSQQLPTLSISWGAWAEVGMAAALVRDKQAQMAALGQGVIAPQQGIAALAGLFQQEMAHVGVLPMDWTKLGAGLGIVPPFLEQVVDQALSAGRFPDAARGAALLAQLRKADPVERRERLNDYVRYQLAHLLRYRSADEIQTQTPILELGMNSLMSVELRNLINRELNINVPLTALLNTTSEQLAMTLSDHLLRAEITAPDILLAPTEETAGQNIMEIVL